MLYYNTALNDLHIINYMDTPININVYDLTSGMAAQYSPMLLGKTIEGVWHSGIVFGNTEYYYSAGICSDYKGMTPFGSPVKNIFIGNTNKTVKQFTDWIRTVQKDFTMENYHIFYHNCNSFTNVAAKFLTGKGIPESIVNQHTEFINTPLGKYLEPLINQMFAGVQGNSHQMSMEEAPLTFSNELENDDEVDTQLNRSKGLMIYFHCTKCEECNTYIHKFNSLIEQNISEDIVFGSVNIDKMKCIQYKVVKHPTIISFFQSQESSRLEGSKLPESDIDNMFELLGCLIQSMPSFKVYKGNKEPYLFSSKEQAAKMTESFQKMILQFKIDSPYLLNYLLKEFGTDPTNIVLEECFKTLSSIPFLSRISLYDIIRVFLIDYPSYKAIVTSYGKSIENECNEAIRYVAENKTCSNTLIMFLRMACNLYKHSYHNLDVDFRLLKLAKAAIGIDERLLEPTLKLVSNICCDPKVMNAIIVEVISCALPHVVKATKADLNNIICNIICMRIEYSKEFKTGEDINLWLKSIKETDWQADIANMMK